MSYPTLEIALGRLPAQNQSLIGERTGVLTAQNILDAALRRRSQWAELEGACVALSGLGSLELILSLVALDGYVSSVLLLPAGSDKQTLERLIAKAGVTHVLNAGEKNLITRGASDAHEDESVCTKWLMATSGTTGTPKIVEHSLASLARTVRVDSQRGPEFVWGLLYDPSRFAGLQVVLQALLSGSVLVAPAAHDFETQITALTANPVNALSATPSLWRKLLMDGRICDSPLRQLTLGGEPVDQHLLDALAHSFPQARITHIYASTEAGAAFAVKDGKAGFPATWLENPNQTPTLRAGADSHLMIKPEVPAQGEEITARTDSDGFLDTEDLIEVDGDRVYFMGRASGAINVGGNKVSPEWLENYLRSIDGVMDAYVYGKQSSMMGSLVAAELIAQEGADTTILKKNIQKLCRTDLESWSVPALIKFVPSLAENGAGKRIRKG